VLYGNERIPIKDAEGNVTSVIEMHNITEKHLLEEERSRPRNRTIGTLAGGIAHDFNNRCGALFQRQ
jgi:hypothetical protein